MSNRRMRDAFLDGGRSKGRNHNRRKETRHYRDNDKLDELPRSAGMSPARGHKVRSDGYYGHARHNYTPIYRFLDKRVNSSWARTRSALLSKFKDTYAEERVREVLKTHVLESGFHVETDPKGFKRVLRTNVSYGLSEIFSEGDYYYVDDHGVLRKPKRSRKKVVREQRKDLSFLLEDETAKKLWTRTGGVWRVFVVHRVPVGRQEWYQENPHLTRPEWGHYDVREKKHVSTGPWRGGLGYTYLGVRPWEYFGAVYQPSEADAKEALAMREKK